MKEKIKVLILEDLSSDAELAEREIKAVLNNYKIVVADTEQGFIEALEDFKPDLIISDYQLPAFDGMKALQITRKKEEFIPFIILTGSMNEETAVECMKAGADDYVIKEHIKRLGAAILGALDKKKIRQERKQAEEALKDREEKINSLFNGIHIPIFVHPFKSEGFANFIEVNNIACQRYGYYREELLKLSPKNISSIEDAQDKGSVESRRRLKEEGQAIFEATHITKDGKRFPVEINSTVFNWAGQKVVLSIAIDITERKLAEKELTKLSTVVTQSPSIIAITDTDGIIEYVNPKFTEITGYSLEEAIGQNPSILKSGEQSEAYYRELWETISSGKVWQGEFHNKKKNGELVWEMALVSPIFDEQGKIINYIKVSEDTTERKQAQYNFRNSIDESPLGIRIVNQEGKTIYVNKALLDIYEFSSLNEFNNTKTKDRYTEKSYREHLERKKIRQHGRDISDYEISIRRKNGEIRHIKVWRKEVIWNREKHFQVINQDITDLKRLNSDLILAKEKAEESEYKIRSMFENTQIGILYCNTEGKILEINQVMLDILGSPSKGATSKINLLTFKPLQENGFAQNIEKCISEKIVVTEDTVYTSKWGKTVFMKYYLVPVILNNKVIGVWANLNNLTDLWNTQKELEKAKEKAEESNRLKTAFLNNMSHEIRTPLNGITGFIGLLQNPKIYDEKKQEYFDIINKSSKRLITTVTDIIDISRIEAGELKVSKSEVSINKILEEQYNFFYQETKYKGIKLNFKSNYSDTESRFVTDKHKLEGILTNLIKNAIKFTQNGSITLGYAIKKGEKNIVEFYVKDTGIGIPEDRLDAIFNRFEQADIADTRAFQGSGLGLAIAKSYVDMLGGKISVKSNEGEGSTFIFSIPYTNKLEKESDAQKNINKEKQASLSDFSLIIAEDDKVSKMFYEAIFKNKFKKITYTTTGKETIEKFHKNPDTDIILMDIKMPKMNGYDVTREIRKFNTDVIIIAQTAFGLSGDRQKAIEAGCDDYISKPIKEKILFEKIRACLNKKNM